MVKLSREIGEIVDVIEGQRAGDPCLSEETALVKDDLADRGFYSNSCVPCAALRAVESPAVGAGMAECRVHDMRLRDAIQQLAGTDREISPSLGQLAFIGRSVQLAQIGEHL